MSRLPVIPAFLTLLLCAAAPDPGIGPGPGIGSATNLPVPRFVSLRSDKVNVRAGPGFQYPVNWVYQREGLPVEIIGEFDVWRQILAPDGGTGWVHEATIRAKRGFYVTSDEATLYDAPNSNAGVVAYLKNGVSGTLLRCGANSQYCKVATKYENGYLARSDIWGVFNGEAVKP
ncbi:MAG: hypothetical protein KGQ26_01205 [Rhodospirillales bacterium]|nr:hypothetical protein [Rhodospirillales bacterium]MDE2320063.1 hypothetical protein [Rhodospirillales bacterium]